MNRTSIKQRWMPLIVAASAWAATAGTGHAQSAITYNFASDLQGWAGNEPAGMAATYTWNATNSSAGGGCMEVTFDGVTTTEMDPTVTLASALNQAQYLSVTVHMKVDAASGTTGTSGSGGYGNLQAIFRDASYSWDSIWFGTVYPPAANDWVTYTFIIPQPYKTAEQHLQLQFQGSAGYSGPVTVYIDNITINPVPNPWLLTAFTDNSVVGSGWDSAEDAPFVNPVTQGAPQNITPAGSWKIQIANPGGYSGWNQYAYPSGVDTTRYQTIGFDVYLDGSSGTTYGGIQLLLIKNGWAGNYNAGSVAFNASMVGKWTHFNFPCAAGGLTNSPAFVFQGIPGSDGGTDTTTFHIDNVVMWNNATRPKILALTPNTTPGGLKIAVDADGNSNQYDQEGITSPAGANSATNFFWMGQTPASYSFTLTNFPAPAVAPDFDAHAYIANGDTLGGNFGYNQTYSGVNWNAADYAGFHVQNGTNGGVVAIFEWKTNSLSSAVNSTNGGTVTCNLASLASANGTWTLNFADDSHGSILAPDGSVVTNFTLPDFSTDPNYTGNFSPATSMIQFGLAKNDSQNTGINNGQSCVFSHILVTNSINGALFDESFSGPGLTANYAWQVAEYYQFSANRTTWIPGGTAYWLTWNTTQSGFAVMSTTNLAAPTWANAGVAYSYTDGTGTNTTGAVPAASLPAGDENFFRLQK